MPEDDIRPNKSTSLDVDELPVESFRKGFYSHILKILGYLQISGNKLAG